MTTQVKIENINGTDALIVHIEDSAKVLLPGESVCEYVYSDSHIYITEADLIKERV